MQIWNKWRDKKIYVVTCHEMWHEQMKELLQWSWLWHKILYHHLYLVLWVAAGEAWDCLSGLSVELPRLVSDTRPFLLWPEGVLGVLGVLPPDDGVLLVTGVPGVRDLPGVPGVRAEERPWIGAWYRPLRCVGVRWLEEGRPFCSITMILVQLTIDWLTHWWLEPGVEGSNKIIFSLLNIFDNFSLQIKCKLECFDAVVHWNVLRITNQQSEWHI